MLRVVSETTRRMSPDISSSRHARAHCTPRRIASASPSLPVFCTLLLREPQGNHTVGAMPSGGGDYADPMDTNIGSRTAERNPAPRDFPQRAPTNRSPRASGTPYARQMKLRLLLATAVGCLAAPAAADARVVEMSAPTYSADEPIITSIKPNRRPPRGWRYEANLLFESKDEDGIGCASYSYASSNWGGRAFSVEFQPQLAKIPSGGAAYWCLGEARVVLFRMKQGTRVCRKKSCQVVATSRTFIVDAPAEDEEDDYPYED